MVNSNWSRFVLVAWLYMTYVVMQSYTAKLSSMFTVDQLNFKPSKDMTYGCQHGTYVSNYVKNNLKISNIKNFGSIEEIHKGMNDGTFDAIYDEIPYVKLLLNKYGSQYKTVGPTYKSAGFGFAFRLDSKLTTYFSRAILNVTESPMWSALEQKNLGPQYSSDNQIDSINNDNPSLTVPDFGGLFIIFGSSMLFALFCKWAIATLNVNNDLQRTNSIVHPKPDPTASDDDSSGENEVEMIGQDIVNTSVVDNQIVFDIPTVSGQIDVQEIN